MTRPNSIVLFDPSKPQIEYEAHVIYDPASVEQGVLFFCGCEPSGDVCDIFLRSLNATNARAYGVETHVAKAVGWLREDGTPVSRLDWKGAVYVEEKAPDTIPLPDAANQPAPTPPSVKHPTPITASWTQSGFSLSVAGLSDVGILRAANEDTFGIFPELGLVVVADGMGGANAGKVASGSAVNAIKEFLMGIQELPAPEARDREWACDAVGSSITTANDMIFGMAKTTKSYKGMGTTVSVLLVAGSHVVIGQVGDSRIYRVRGGHIEQLTEDHSLFNEEFRRLMLEEEAKTSLSPEQLEEARRRVIAQVTEMALPTNIITRAVGTGETVEVDVTSHEARDGDVYLLCSDGLTGAVADGRISEIISTNTDLNASVKALIAEANKNGGPDNITAVLMRVKRNGDAYF